MRSEVLEGTIRGIVAVSLVLVLSLATCGDAPRPATDAEPRPTMTEMVGVITEVHGSSGGVLWFQLSPLRILRHGGSTLPETMASISLICMSI